MATLSNCPFFKSKCIHADAYIKEKNEFSPRNIPGATPEVVTHMWILRTVNGCRRSCGARFDREGRIADEWKIITDFINEERRKESTNE